jgi:hypothetical protein
MSKDMLITKRINSLLKHYATVFLSQNKTTGGLSVMQSNPRVGFDCLIDYWYETSDEEIIEDLRAMRCVRALSILEMQEGYK